MIPDNAPARIVITRFRDRGITQSDLARILHVEPSTVSRWLKTRQEGGTGGAIPHRHQQGILDAARLRRVKLRAAELVTKGTVWQANW
jgi:transcriptional regulator with XRE-family HTH domain